MRTVQHRGEALDWIPSTRASRSARVLLLAWVLGVGSALAVLGVHAGRYLPFVADDALISLRYAERLLDGRGLTWTDGERVEGYSNLLWVLACGAVGSLGMDLIAAARAIGLACTVLAILAVARPAMRAGWPGLSAGTCGMLGMALVGPIAVWSIGGLEQPLQAALLAIALVRSYPLLQAHLGRRARAWPAAIPLALLCWTRPDGPLFTAALFFGVLFARGLRRSAVRDATRLLPLPVAATMLQLAFRLAYYGDWVPNPFHAKVGFTTQRLTEGVLYLRDGLLAMSPLAIPALALASVVDRRSEPRVHFLLAPLLAWMAYVAVIGGDVFPAWRHLSPVAVILALLLVEGMLSFSRRGARAAVGSFTLVLACLGALGWLQFRAPANRRAISERWEWDGEVAGRFLQTAFGEHHPLLAVDPAGSLPYFSKLPSLDLLGLNDRHLARKRPADFGTGALGHELGDGRYVLDRAPDLVVFCTPRGSRFPCFRSGVEMVDDARWRSYRLVTYLALDPRPLHGLVWVLAEGGRLGIRRGRERVHVPGYLFCANAASVACLDSDDRPGMSASMDLPAALDVELDAGAWKMTVSASGGLARSELIDPASGAILARGGDVVAFVHAGGALRVVILAEADSHLHVLEATFERP